MKIVKQGISYGLVGLFQIGIDWLAFIVLTQLGIGAVAGNLLGRLTGAGFGFWLNGSWTFSDGQIRRTGKRHLVRFGAVWLSTALASTILVAMASHYQGLHTAWVVKPAIDLFLAGLSFLASKFWIYRD